MPRVALCGLNLAPGIGMAPMSRSRCSNQCFELGEDFTFAADLVGWGGAGAVPAG